MEPITDPLRRAIKASGESMLGLQKATGVHRTCITGFLAGKQGLRVYAADQLARYLGLELRPIRKTKGR